MVKFNSCFDVVTTNNIWIHECFHGGLAQLGEHLPYKQEVTGSIPVSSIEPLAQLVEHLTFNQRVGSSRLPRLIASFLQCGRGGTSRRARFRF